MSLAEAVGSSRLEGLRALRKVLADEIEAASGSAAASLAHQLRDTLREIESLEKLIPKGSVVDDLASRRKGRGAGSSGVRAAGGGGL